MTSTDVKNYVTIAIYAGAIYFIYTNREKIKSWFNPTSDQNLAYQGTNAALRAVGIEETLGTWAYNFLRGHTEYDSYAMRPYTKADGTRGVFVTQVIRRSDGKIFNVIDGLFGPTLEAA